MSSVFKLASLLLVFVASAGQAQSFVFTPEEVIVSALALNIRASPDVNADKVATATRGERLRVLEVYNDGEYFSVDDRMAPWYKVSYKQQVGYVFGAYVQQAYQLLFENSFFSDDALLPECQWYGIYARDSFADELRPIRVRLEMTEDEVFGQIQVVRTDQKDTSKFIIGSISPLRPGYAGPLGASSVNDLFISSELQPGAAIGIFAGSDFGEDRPKPIYSLVGSGCAELDDMAMLRFRDFRIQVIDYAPENPRLQDISGWLIPEDQSDFYPIISVIWYGDIDGDDSPDALIHDCPNEAGCRASLFLSSLARKGEFLRKATEYFFLSY